MNEFSDVCPQTGSQQHGLFENGRKTIGEWPQENA